MNKLNFLSTFFIAGLVFLISCGPAAEDRQAMHARAKVFQDSIAASIRNTIAEAEMPAQAPAPATVMPAPTPTTK